MNLDINTKNDDDFSSNKFRYFVGIKEILTLEILNYNWYIQNIFNVGI